LDNTTVNTKTVELIYFFNVDLLVSSHSRQRTGLGVVGGFGKRPPGTEADALLMYKIRTNAHRCLSSPNNCCHVAEDEDNNVLPQ
jgi:hypothetical protein